MLIPASIQTYILHERERAYELKRYTIDLKNPVNHQILLSIFGYILYALF